MLKVFFNFFQNTSVYGGCRLKIFLENLLQNKKATPKDGLNNYETV